MTQPRKKVRKKRADSVSGRPNRESGQVSFWDHLEELRRRVLWSLLAIGLAAAGSYAVAGRLLAYLTVSVGSLVYIKPYEAFFLKIKVALFAGMILAMPVVFYHLWRFIAEALTPHEKKTVASLVAGSIALFLVGAFFSYKIIVPLGMEFFLHQGLPGLVPMITADAYFSYFFWMIAVFGLVFEMPLVVWFLSRFGLLEPGALQGNRRIMIVGLSIAAALLTPPDVVSQILLFVPLWLLLEISIWIARMVHRRAEDTVSG